MDFDKNTVLKIIRDILTPAQLKRSFIYWEKKVHEKGEEMRIGFETVPLPFTGTMVFVDLAPAYNWAHPCLYIFIDCTEKKTHMIEASFPPFNGTPDEHFVILLRFGDIPPNERYFSAFDQNEPEKKGDTHETE